MYGRMNTPARRVRPASPSSQTDLFAAPSGLPEGFRYYPEAVSVEEEEALAHELGALPFKPFNFQGFLANRQVVSFGYRYDYDRRAVVEAAPFPSFLIPLRRKVAAIFDRPEEILPPGSHQRISARRGNRLASGQGAVRRSRQRVAAGALHTALSPQGGPNVGPRVAHDRAALGLSAFGPCAHGLGAQHSRSRPASLFDHLADAGCLRPAG